MRLFPRKQAPAQGQAPKPREVQFHLVVACSDARQAKVSGKEITQQVMDKYAKKGIALNVQYYSIPGAFLQESTGREIANYLKDKERELKKRFGNGVNVKMFAHFRGHGELKPVASPHGPTSLHASEPVEGSAVNCGMLGATKLAIEIEDQILTNKPKVYFGGKSYRLNTPQAIRDFNKEAYGERQTFTGLVESFADPRPHIRKQMASFREILLKQKNLPDSIRRMELTAGVNNYKTGETFRVDDKSNSTAFDEIESLSAKKFKNLSPTDSRFLQRTGAQKPLMVLLHHPDVEDPRAEAFTKFAPRQAGESLAGRIFAISATTKKRPLSLAYRAAGMAKNKPLDLYSMAGIYFAATHYGTKNIVVMGKNSSQASELKQRLYADPYFQAITQVLGKQGIRLKYYTLTQGHAGGPIEARPPMNGK